MAAGESGRGRARGAGWDQTRLRALRRHLGLSQQGLAGELGVRQQTVSEWETGAYRPRGASARLLGIVAERAGFSYQAGFGPLTPDNRGTTEASAPASDDATSPATPDGGGTTEASTPASD